MLNYTNMEWDKDTTITLISNFEKYDCLWNVVCKDYKNQQKKKDAWYELAKTLNVDVDCVDKKIKSLLAAYRRERKRENDSMKSGAGRDKIYKSKWFAFHRFKFLNGINKPKKTRNSIKEVNVAQDNGSFNLSESQLESTETGADLELKMETETENENNFDQFNDSTQETITSIPEIVQSSQNKLKTTNLGKIKQKNLDKERFSPALEKVSKIMESLIEMKRGKEMKTKDMFSIYGELIGCKIRNLETKVEQAIVQNHINQILFLAEMGYYRNNETYSRPSTANSVVSETSN